MNSFGEANLSPTNINKAAKADKGMKFKRVGKRMTAIDLLRIEVLSLSY
jgi:hypothetical protein